MCKYCTIVKLHVVLSFIHSREGHLFAFSISAYVILFVCHSSQLSNMARVNIPTEVLGNSASAPYNK